MSKIYGEQDPYFKAPEKWHNWVRERYEAFYKDEQTFISQPFNLPDIPNSVHKIIKNNIIKNNIIKNEIIKNSFQNYSIFLIKAVFISLKISLKQSNQKFEFSPGLYLQTNIPSNKLDNMPIKSIRFFLEDILFSGSPNQDDKKDKEVEEKTSKYPLIQVLTCPYTFNLDNLLGKNCSCFEITPYFPSYPTKLRVERQY